MSDAKVSEGKHTAGPWQYGPTGPNMKSYSQPFGVHGYVNGKVLTIICGCFGDVHGGEEVAQANARLIAAAPTNPHNCGDETCSGYKAWLEWQSLRDINKDLLEALRNIFEECTNPEICWETSAKRARNIAEAAIAKAEGR